MGVGGNGGSGVSGGGNRGARLLRGARSAVGSSAASFLHRVPLALAGRVLSAALTVEPGVASGTVRVPGSKSISNRVLLMAGIAEGVGAPFERLLRASNFLDLLLHCLRYDDPDVQASAFAALGEVGKACPGYVAGALPLIVPVALTAMERTSEAAGFAGGYTAEGDDADDEGICDEGDEVTNVCNNAIWSMGEIAVKVGAQAMAPFVPALVAK